MAIVYNHINFTHRKLIWFFVFDKLNMLRSIVCELDVKNMKEISFYKNINLKGVGLNGKNFKTGIHI